jgi:hypothetical protein
MLARSDQAVGSRMSLRPGQADVAQQALVEPRQLPRAGAPASAASHRLNHRLVDEANGTGNESGQRPVAVPELLVAYHLYLQNGVEPGDLLPSVPLFRKVES